VAGLHAREDVEARDRIRLRGRRHLAELRACQAQRPRDPRPAVVQRSHLRAPLSLRGPIVPQLVAGPRIQYFSATMPSFLPS
jgi:hypothetical protein